MLISLVLTALLNSDDTQPVERPNFKFLRWTEDWSEWNPTPDSTLLDSMKKVALNEDGSAYVSFGGHARFRLESFGNFAFGAPNKNDELNAFWRALVHADFHLNESFRIYVEGKHSYGTDRSLPGTNRSLDRDTLDLEQAFADYKHSVSEDKDLTFRVGRQALLLGSQRLVSPLGWSNTLRRWDGGAVVFDSSCFDVTLFATEFVPVDKYDFNDPDKDTDFWGAYTTVPVSSDALSLDVYYLGLHQTTATFNSTSGTEDRHTTGVRAFGKGGEFLDYDAEYAYQFGEVDSSTIRAYMIGAEVGFTVPEVDGEPRFFVGYDVGSGDDRPGGTVQTFNQLFPLGHAYLGAIDIIGRQNVQAISVGASAKPGAGLKVQVVHQTFQRHDNDDALYNAGGLVVRPGSAANSRQIGSELDFTLTYQSSRHLKWLLGYSHFFAGDFIEDSGKDDDIDFAYLQAQFTF